MRNFFNENSWFLLLILPLISFLLIYRASPWGLGITPDSITYYSTAKNIQEGKGLVATSAEGANSPLVHFPPLYPIVLSSFNIDVLTSAKVLNVFTFGIVIFISGLFIFVKTKNIRLGLITQFLIILSGNLILVFSMLWSEPLFILLTVAGLCLLALYIKHQKLYFLVLAVVFFGLTTIERYIGIVFVVLVPIVIIFLLKEKLWKKILIGTISGIAISTPVVLWGLYLKSLNAKEIRDFDVHLIDKARIVSGVQAVAEWFFPKTLTANHIFLIFFVIACFIVFLTLIVSLIRKRKDFSDIKKRYSTEIILILFMFLYVGFLVTSISFFDEATPLDFRILSPLIIPFFLLLILVITKFKSRLLRIAIILVVLILELFGGVSQLNNNLNNDLGFANPEIYHSDTINFVKHIPSDSVILTNSFESIYIVAQRDSILLPYRLNSQGEVSADYSIALKKVVRNSKPDKVYIAYFTGDFNRKWRSIKESELKKILNLQLVAEYTDGNVYLVK